MIYLRIDLTQFFECSQYNTDIDYTIDMSDYIYNDKKPFTTPVSVVGSIAKSTEIISLDITISFIMELECDRCLTEFKQDYTINTSHIIVASSQSDDVDFIIVGSERLLDIDEIVISDILLELPVKFLCSDQCQGLCSGCGADLNKQQCKCNKKEIDPRFKILDQLVD